MSGTRVIEDGPGALAYGVLASLMEASQDVVRVLDLEGRLECINREGRRLLGITDFDQRLRGVSWPSLWPADCRPRLTAALAAAAEGRTARFEAACVSSTGEGLWLDTIVTPVRDGAGHIVRLLATSRDVTELKRLRSAVRPGAEQHNVLTPLHGLVGITDLLGQTDLTDKQRSMLVRLKECADALTTALCEDPAPSSAHRTAPAPRKIAAGSTRVLVVDDNRINRDLLCIAFELINANVVVAENGAQACDLCEVERFDLVIMDFQMPVMDGITALRLIRAREAEAARPRTPVVVFTASDVGDCERASRAAGADGFLTKPLSPMALIDAVTPLLERRAPVDRMGGACH